MHYSPFTFISEFGSLQTSQDLCLDQGTRDDYVSKLSATSALNICKHPFLDKKHPGNNCDNLPFPLFHKGRGGDFTFLQNLKNMLALVIKPILPRFQKTILVTLHAQSFSLHESSLKTYPT